MTKFSVMFSTAVILFATIFFVPEKAEAGPLCRLFGGCSGHGRIFSAERRQYRRARRQQYQQQYQQPQAQYYGGSGCRGFFCR